MSHAPFHIIERRYIPAVRSTVTIAENPSGGARLVHLLCEEEREHFFAACFRTPPHDDTGVPHIIEHTVLNGSAGYPVKDPFMEMVKSSMATYINAATHGDRTVYPCGSLNRTDFLNLVSVYMDAVFYPLLKEEFFLQEGYRLEMDESGSLLHSGVVYNEMKGVYSDPDSCIERDVARTLYPAGTCGRDSGGDPLAITGLTYSEFKAFHETHYTPENCCLFALTGIPFEEFSEFIGGMLPDRKRKTPPPEFIPQESFEKPVREDIPVPASGDGCTVLSAWKVNSAGDPVETLAFSLLEEVLLDDDSSPVKSVLLDSGLGTGLSSCGYDDDCVERNFVIGLKGVQRDSGDRVLALIRDTLGSIHRDGLDRRLVKNMLHRKELQLKYTGSGWPGALMNAVTTAWAHNEDIMTTLDLNLLLDGLKSRMAKNPRFLEDMTGRWLLSNPHRADLVFYPDEEHFRRIELEEQEALEERKGEMSPEEIAALRKMSEDLLESMEKPSTPEELATLPKLSLSDISKTPPEAFYETIDTDKGPLILTNLHSAGVCYIDLVIDLSSLPGDLIPHLSFYTSLMTRTGAGGKSHIELAEEELECSGGITASMVSQTETVDSVDCFRILMKVSGYCLSEDLPRMLDVMRRRILSPDFDDISRITTIAGEIAEMGRSTLIPRGHSAVMLTARAGLTAGHYASNLLKGIPVFKLASGINRENAPEETISLNRIREHLREGVPWTIAMTGPGEGKQLLMDWFEDIPSSKVPCPPDILQFNHQGKLGIRIPGGTGFAGAALPGIPMSSPLAAPGDILMTMLSDGFLWDEIRAKQGAYGAGLSTSGGTITFYSYRDPSPSSSLKVFREAVAHGMEKVDPTARSIEDSIISSLKGVNPAIRPAMANGIALNRLMKGLDTDAILRQRERLLGVNRASMGEFAQWLASVDIPFRICVMGNETTIRSCGISEILEL